MGKGSAGHRFFIVDVFGKEKFAGNQLAVVLPEGRLPDAAMQRIAREFNFAETTFVTSLKPKQGGYDVRIFTPRKEVPFAGHPTLGTAYVIRKVLGLKSPGEIGLNLKVGRIPVRFEKGKQGLLWVRQNPPVFGAIHQAKELAPALGLAEKDFDAAYPIQEATTGLPVLLVPLRNLAAVKKARTDMAAYEAYFAQASKRAGRSAGGRAPAKRGNREDARGPFDGPLPMFVFSRETYTREAGINARMFADLFGVPEDAATGSANGCLAGYLLRYGYADRARTEDGRIRIRVEQGYEMGRNSLLHLDAGAIGSLMDVNVGGKVFEVAEGLLK
jgi:trans-2,3-dihydro-3-hydroxyanthranilate isomerase